MFTMHEDQGSTTTNAKKIIFCNLHELMLLCQTLSDEGSAVPGRNQGENRCRAEQEDLLEKDTPEEPGSLQ